ncbi:MAG: hypothetical protein MZV64_42950 [Ignavibacteriales bacterium]|nr:hypothetical protein [Ignavibacteriales bacterium]
MTCAHRCGKQATDHRQPPMWWADTISSIAGARWGRLLTTGASACAVDSSRRRVVGIAGAACLR